jgi:hypothetical protein
MKKKNKYKEKILRVNKKIEENDLLICLAKIKHLSIKFKITGKISRNVQNKWKKRVDRQDSFCRDKYKPDRTCCKWLPASVFKRRQLKFWFNFMWECRVCHCVTSRVYDEEISIPLQNAYSENVITHKWD